MPTNRVENRTPAPSHAALPTSPSRQTTETQAEAPLFVRPASQTMEDPAVSYTLSPLRGAIMAMSSGLASGDVVVWQADDGRRMTLMRDIATRHVHVGTDDTHVEIPSVREAPVMFNGEVTTQDTLADAASMMRAAMKRLTAGIAPAAPRAVRSAPVAVRDMQATVDPATARRALCRQSIEARLTTANAAPLKNASHARLDLRKLTQYALKRDHPDNNGKADEFKRALGFTQANAAELRTQILGAIADAPAFLDYQGNTYKRYCADLGIRGDHGKATVRTVWTYEKGLAYPALVTCYVRRPDWREVDPLRPLFRAQPNASVTERPRTV